MKLLGGAARFAGPTMLLMGALQGLSTPGGLGAKTQGAASGLTFGVIPRPVSDEERAGAMQGAVQDVIGDLPQGGGLKSQRRAVGRLQGLVDTRGNAGQAFGDIEMDTDSIKEGTEMLRAELKMRRQLLRETIRGQNEEMRRASIEHANRLTVDFGRAFNVRSKAVGPAAAMDRLGKDVSQKLEHLKPAGRKILSENMLAWGEEMAKRNPALRDEVERLEKQIKRSWTRTGRHVQIVNGEILVGSKSEWKNIRTALTTQTEIARQETSDDFTAIQQKAIGSLRSMGFDTGQARQLVQAMEHGGSQGRLAKTNVAVKQAGGQTMLDPVTPGTGRARGGRVPGLGRQDTVPLGGGFMGAPDELIVNAHSEREVNAVLAEKGMSLEGIVHGEYKRHAWPATSRPRRPMGLRGSLMRSAGMTQAGGHTVPASMMARGGRVPIVSVPGFPGERANRSILDEIAFYTSRFGLRLTDAYGQGHQSPGHTIYGTAADLAGPDAAMDRAVRALVGAGYKTLYDGRFGSIAWPGHGPSSVAGGNAHIHVEFGSNTGTMKGAAGMAGGGGAIGKINLRGRKGSRGGMPGLAHDLATELYAGGLEKKINDELMGGAIPGGAGAGAAGGNLNSWLTQALRITGHYSAANLAALRGRAMQESGGNPNAQNNWDVNARNGTPSIGLLQTIGPTFNAYKLPGMNDIRNPVHNTVAAIRYMFARYGHIVGPGGGGYALGGRLPGEVDWGGWNAKGGDFMVNRPTIFGAGEAGRERVTISRAGGPQRGSVRVVMERGAVQIRAGGANADEVGRIVESKLEDFADMIREELEDPSDRDAEEVMG